MLERLKQYNGEYCIMAGNSNMRRCNIFGGWNIYGSILWESWKP